MKDFKEFITIIQTVGFNRFLPVFDVLDEEDVQPSTTDWNTAKFKRFLGTEEGIKIWLHVNEVESCVPSFELLQHALTDLKNLTREQQQAQVNHLYDLACCWGTALGGILHENSLIHNANNSKQGIRLFFFDMDLKVRLITTQNIPFEDNPLKTNNIFLRKDFYDDFVECANQKISAIGYLISASGITPTELLNQSKTAHVPFVEKQNNAFTNDTNNTDLPTAHEEDRPTPGQPTLTLRQIALLNIYQGNMITQTNANEIARTYFLNSGERLYKLYNNFIRTNDRVGIEGKAIKLFIADIEKVIPFLNNQQKQQAETEKKLISAKLLD